MSDFNQKAKEAAEKYSFDKYGNKATWSQDERRICQEEFTDGAQWAKQYLTKPTEETEKAAKEYASAPLSQEEKAGYTSSSNEGSAFDEGFDAGHATAMETVQELTERINAIAENIGIDAVQVHYETIWVDPNNVRLQLEQSIKSCERWTHQLREALSKFRGNNEQN
jgi:hypothetical protein